MPSPYQWRELCQQTIMLMMTIIIILPCCIKARGDIRDLPEAGVAGLSTLTTPLLVVGVAFKQLS